MIKLNIAIRRNSEIFRNNDSIIPIEYFKSTSYIGSTNYMDTVDDIKTGYLNFEP